MGADYSVIAVDLVPSNRSEGSGSASGCAGGLRSGTFSTSANTILITDGAAGDHRAQNRPPPVRHRRLRDACSLSRLDDFPAPWSRAHMLFCNREDIDFDPHSQTTPLALLAVTHRL
jgi:hypothetical protein